MSTTTNTNSNTSTNYLSQILKFNRNPIDLRNNAFDFVRLVLALIVAYSHAPYVGGYGIEPVYFVTYGTVAMYAFFVISGFLITGSFVKSQSAWQYIEKRARRIFPGLWMSLFIYTFVLSPVIFWIVHKNFNNYFPREVGEGFHWILDTLTSEVRPSKYTNWAYSFGTILDTAAVKVMNGPIWSIIFEIKAYLLVALFGGLGIFKRQWTTLILCGIFWWAYNGVISNGSFASYFNLFFEDSKLAILFGYFFAGSFFYVFQKRIIWDWKIFLPLVFLFDYLVKINMVGLGLPIFAYCTLYLCQALPIRNLGRKFGDVSYGVYIYHWGVQQLFFFLAIHKISPELSTWGSMIISVIIGYLSYHLVEKKFLRSTNLSTNLAKDSTIS